MCSDSSLAYDNDTMLLPICFVLIICTSQSHSVRLWPGLRNHDFPLSPPTRDSCAKIEKGWYTQKLDHFDSSNTQTWDQKYYTNFQNKGGEKPPVFLFLGGAYPLDRWWIQSSQIASNYAPYYKAIMVALEHRYYGESQPTLNMSLENLKYLSSEQALKDAASFIEFFKQKHQLTDNKWIVFGGGYSGSLAAWMRLKYSHHVKGAVASSAPVLAVADFKEYYGNVENYLGEKCTNPTREANREMEKLLQSDYGKRKLQRMFRLKQPLNSATSNDISLLFNILASGVYDSTRNDKAILNYCLIMTDDSDNSTPLARFASIYGDIHSYNYDLMLIIPYRNINYQDNAHRPWLYQTCNEFGYFQTSSYGAHIFGTRFPLEFWIQRCAGVFGPQFNKKFILNAIDKTNSNYGGSHPSLTNVIFPNGELDSWNKLSILEDINETSRAVLIKRGNRYEDMYNDSPHDSKSLREARRKIKEAIGEFLKNSF